MKHHTHQFRTLCNTAIFVSTLLLIEFLDEFVFGAREAAWPLIRTDLSLSYAQVGLLLGAPSLVSSLVEPFLGILGDVWRRRVLILGGGAVFTLALLLAALTPPATNRTWRAGPSPVRWAWWPAPSH